MKLKNIVLVEDNPNDAALAIRAFKKINIANPVIILEDGMEALDYFFCRNKYADRDINDFPGLVLLDLKLPVVGGIEVLKQIRSQAATKAFVVVVLTSSTEQQDLVDCYELGANSYIRKPIDFNQFVEALKQIGFYWLSFNETPKIALNK